MGIFSRRRFGAGTAPDDQTAEPDPEFIAFARTLIRPGFVHRADAATTRWVR